MAIGRTPLKSGKIPVRTGFSAYDVGSGGECPKTMRIQKGRALAVGGLTRFLVLAPMFGLPLFVQSRQIPNL